MSDFRIDQITNQAGTAGPQVAGITTFNSPSGLVMPRGDTSRRYVFDSVPNNVITDGLVLYLDAGNTESYAGSGTVWTDLSGQGNNGTLTNGPTYSSANGGSLVFDGTNDYATIPDITGVTDFTNTDNYTVDFWFYPNSTQNNTSILTNSVVEKWSEGAGVGYPYVFRYVRADQNMRTAVYNGTSQNIVNIQISPNNWWNICGVFNWSSSSLTTYGNGGLVSNSVTLNVTGDITNSSPLNLMRRGSNTAYATGNLSSLKIYNRALTAQEIQQNYNALKGRYI